MSTMEQLVQLERAVDELARRFDRVAAHEPGVQVPAVEELAALERHVREAGLGRPLSAAERARLDQLTARVNTRAPGWRQLAAAAKPRPAPAAAPPPKPEPVHVPEPEPPPPTVAGRGGPDATRLEEYRRLFARYQTAMERAGEPIPTSLDRFVRELEEQRQRLVARGVVVEGFDVVREPSGIRVRPRTRSAGGH